MFEVFRALWELAIAVLNLGIHGFVIWNLFAIVTSERGSVDEHNAIRGAVSWILVLSISTYARVAKMESKR
jgi:hypothetical protein